MAGANVIDITVKDSYQSGGGFSKASKEVKNVGEAADKAGKEFDQLGDDAKKSAKAVGAAAEETEKKVGGMGEKLASAGKTAGLAGGAAIGGAVAFGFAKSLEFDTANAKLKAQLGGSAQYAGDMGKLAGDLYSNAYGSSLGEVSDALAAVVQSGALMEDATNEQIKSITGQAMSMAGAFGIDVPQAMMAVSRMVKTGMVPDAQEGLNLIAVAFQQLGPGAEDVLDTFTEYSSQFQKIGLDGPTAMGMINQMMDAGARSTDLAADALKEFSIRAIDGSKKTVGGFEAIGLNAEQMRLKFLAGGESASQAFDQVVAAIKNTHDPIKQSEAVMALFGTQAEDLGGAIMAIDANRAADSLGNFATAAEDVDKAMGDTAQAKIDSMTRGFEKLLAGMVNAPGILGQGGAAIAAFGGGALTMGSQLAMLSVALPEGFRKTALAAVLNFGKMTLAVAGYVATSIAGAAAATAAWIVANAAMLLGIGAIILVIAGIIVVIALMIKHWDWVKEKAAEVWHAVAGFFKMLGQAIADAVMWVINWVKEHWQLLLAIFMGPLGILIGLLITHWDKVKAIFTKAINAVLDVVKWLGRLPGMVLGYIGQMVSAAIGKAGELIGWFMGLGGRLLGAIGDIAGKMLGLGWDIVMGIWHGIERGWSRLVDMVKNLARTLLNAAKSAIGIASKSKAFDREFGAMIPLGAASGVDRTAGVARDAVRRMATGTLDQVGRYRAAAPGVSAATQTAFTAQLTPIVLQFKTGGAPVEEFLAELIKRYVRVQGGDVQAVFGR